MIRPSSQKGAISRDSPHTRNGDLISPPASSVVTRVLAANSWSLSEVSEIDAQVYNGFPTNLGVLVLGRFFFFRRFFHACGQRIRRSHAFTKLRHERGDSGCKLIDVLLLRVKRFDLFRIPAQCFCPAQVQTVFGLLDIA